jgi:hypothetical protein
MDRYREKHRLEGLCISCFRPRYKGGLCRYHYDAMRETQSQRYTKKRAEQGFPKGKTRCRRCWELGHNARTCKNPIVGELPGALGGVSLPDLLHRLAETMPRRMSLQSLIAALGRAATEEK